MSRLITIIADEKISGKIKDWLPHLGYKQPILLVNDDYEFPMSDMLLRYGGQFQGPYNQVADLQETIILAESAVYLNPPRNDNGRLTLDVENIFPWTMRGGIPIRTSLLIADAVKTSGLRCKRIISQNYKPLGDVMRYVAEGASLGKEDVVKELAKRIKKEAPLAIES